MPRLESSVQRAVVTYAKEKHALICIKLSTLGRFGTTGWPDYIFLGRKCGAFFIEFKAPGKEQTELQKHKAVLLRAQGFHVYVVDDPDEGKSVIDKEAA